MIVTVDLLNASGQLDHVPSDTEFELWAQTTMQQLIENNVNQQNIETIELSIRLVDAAESAQLNQHYRHKQGPTNILSFPYDGPVIDDFACLGDLAICAQVIQQEAQEQGKTSQAHWAHMAVHGVLHLNGFDHENTEDAEEMEAQEIQILKKLGFSDPYQ